MGAGRLTVARRITFPLAAPGVIAAAIFAFITSFDEFFVAQFLSTVNATTLPVQIFNVLEFEADPTVTAVSVGLIGIAVLALALAGLARWLGAGRQSGLLPVEPPATAAVGAGETT
jgi:putative spermidine/putrescine transport system permease protein